MMPSYNFTNLDLIIDWLYLRELKPIFEIMGNPSKYFNNFLDTKQANDWHLMIKLMIQHFIGEIERIYTRIKIKRNVFQINMA